MPTIRFTGQTVAIRHDVQNDALEMRVVYRGVSAWQPEDRDDVERSVRIANRIADGGPLRMALGDDREDWEESASKKDPRESQDGSWEVLFQAQGSSALL